MATNCLCEDMAIQILSRLPPKWLLRFRCVSKSWCSLIDNKLRWRALPSTMLGFIYQRIRHSIRDSMGPITLCVLGVDDCQVDPKLSFLQPRPLTIKHCSNGLLLCYYDSYKRYYYICNPATKRWANVPEVEDDWKPSLMVLAYDPFSSPYCKVLRVFYSKLEFQIFSSEQGCWGDWRTMESLPPDLVFCQNSRPSSVCHRGTLYLKTKNHILLFDISEEIFVCLAFPDGAADPFLGKLGGYVCCASISISEDGGAELRIWMLDPCSNNHQWQLKHCSGLNEPFQKKLNGVGDRQIAEARMVAFHESSDVVFFKICRFAVYAYDLEKRELELFLPSGGILCPFSPCWLDDWRTKHMHTELLPEELDPLLRTNQANQARRREACFSRMKAFLQSR